MNIKEQKFALTGLNGSISTRVVIPEGPIALLVLAHGAGAGINHSFMIDVQNELARVNIASYAFNFLYRELGERTPFRMTKPMKTWVEVWNHVQSIYDLPMFVAGKSYGGRVGSMVIDQLIQAKGLIFLGYPFHPPNNQEKLRTSHLNDISLPMLFLQGSRDNLSSPEIANNFVNKHTKSTIIWLEDGDHSWNPRKKSGFTLKDHMQRACFEIKSFCQKNRG